MTAADVAFTFNLIKKVPAPRPQLHLVGAQQRDAGRRHSRDGLQERRRCRTSTTSPTRPDRAAAHLVHDLEPGHLRRHQPDRHRRVHASARAPRRTSPTWPTRTTGSRASPRSPRCCTRRSPPTTRPTPTSPPARPSGAASSSRTSQAFYTSKSPDNHYWFPPIANVSLIPNLTAPGLSNLAVRQAIAYAIDRNKVGQIGEYGEEPGANQNDIARPRSPRWIDTTAAAKYNYGYDPAKAKQLLSRRATRWAATASSPRTASSCRSRSSTSAASPTGSPRCR